MYSRFNTISGCDRQKDRETTLDSIVHGIERKKNRSDIFQLWQLKNMARNPILRHEKTTP